MRAYHVTLFDNGEHLSEFRVCLHLEYMFYCFKSGSCYLVNVEVGKEIHELVI